MQFFSQYLHLWPTRGFSVWSCCISSYLLSWLAILHHFQVYFIFAWTTFKIYLLSCALFCNRVAKQKIVPEFHARSDSVAMKSEASFACLRNLIQSSLILQFAVDFDMQSRLYSFESHCLCRVLIVSLGCRSYLIYDTMKVMLLNLFSLLYRI